MNFKLEQYLAAIKKSDGCADKATIIELANKGHSMDSIADLTGLSVLTVIVKCNGYRRAKDVVEFKYPHRETVQQEECRYRRLEESGELATLTMAEVATAFATNVQQVKSMLVRRSFDCKDFSGSARRAEINWQNRDF